MAKIKPEDTNEVAIYWPPLFWNVLSLQKWFSRLFEGLSKVFFGRLPPYMLFSVKMISQVASQTSFIWCFMWDQTLMVPFWIYNSIHFDKISNTTAWSAATNNNRVCAVFYSWLMALTFVPLFWHSPYIEWWFELKKIWIYLFSTFLV